MPACRRLLCCSLLVYLCSRSSAHAARLYDFETTDLCRHMSLYALQVVQSNTESQWQHMLAANVLRILHDPDSFDQSGLPPAITKVTVGGHDFSFQNNGWLEGSTAFAVHDISSLQLTIHLELGHKVDSMANLLTVVLEEHPVVMHECYQGEPMKVCCCSASCLCLPLRLHPTRKYSQNKYSNGTTLPTLFVHLR